MNLYAGYMSAMNRDNAVGRVPTAQLANSYDEARGILLKACEIRFPSSEGYHSHYTDCVEVPLELLKKVINSREK